MAMEQQQQQEDSDDAATNSAPAAVNEISAGSGDKNNSSNNTEMKLSDLTATAATTKPNPARNSNNNIIAFVNYLNNSSSNSQDFKLEATESTAQSAAANDEAQGESAANPIPVESMTDSQSSSAADDPPGGTDDPGAAVASSPSPADSSPSDSSPSDSSPSDGSNQEEPQPQQALPKKSALQWKEDGNTAYARKQYQHALTLYEQGIQACQSESDALVGADLYVSLLSNRAMTLIKLQEYQLAQECCTHILQNHHSNNPQQQRNPSSTHSSLIHKVFYRRAMSREGLARDPHLPHAARVKMLYAAKSDLQASLKAMEQKDAATGQFLIGDQERQATKLTVAIAAQRIQKQLSSLDQQQQQQQKPTNGAGGRNRKTNISSNLRSSNNNSLMKRKTPLSSSATSSMMGSTLEAVPEDLVDPKSQRQDLVRLLLSRQSALQQQIGGKSVAAAHGEAFFVLAWEWWVEFCHYADFFCWKQPSKQVPAIQAKLLSYFPPGATVPAQKMDNEDGEEKKDKTSSDDEEEDEEEEDEMEPPGPIDNASLFLFPDTITTNSEEEEEQANDNDENEKTTQQLFHEQWYSKTSPSSKNNKNGAPNLAMLELKPNLVRGYHYEIIPREVYNALREWYGEVTPSICRRAVRSTTGVVSVPLYLVDDDDYNFASQSNKPIQYCGACRVPNVSLRCRRCLAVYYCDRGCQENHWPFHKVECRAVQQDPSGSGENASSPRQAQEPMMLSMGNVGLNNLGNTCFMNSALQCLSHAAPLSRLFLSGRFRQDLNTENPLGTGGKLANAYEQTLKELWMKANARSTSPTMLKRAIALFAPRFAGFQQHDAQEFLAYLLDGLHEDLNRIREAPYVEMPDVEEREDMAVAGSRAWDAHRRRNDSLVMDSFYGQFKSTCVCPQCNRVSVSFDAFNHVSLEIPQEQNAIVPLTVLLLRATTPNRPGSLPVRYAMEVRRDHPISHVKMELSRMSGVPRERLHVCECFEGEITRMFRDEHSVSMIKPKDMIVVYEAESMENPRQESFHILLKHRKPVPNPNNTAGFEWEAFGLPLLISFPTSMKCDEVWEYLWLVVQDKVDEDYKDRFKEVVQFRIHNGEGRGIPAFPLPTQTEEKEEEESEPERTPLIPRQLKISFRDCLWETAVNNFLSIFVEWRDLTPTEAGEQKEQDEDGSESTIASGAAIDEDRFAQLETHHSWIDVTAKRKEQSASRGVSLDQCFEAFVKPERLDERNKWYCSKCRQHVRAMKTMELWRLPNILVVHLKRFEFKNIVRRDKLDTLVHFPLDGLNMNAHSARTGAAHQHHQRFVDESVPADYDLFAVVNHFGRMGFGHYTAFARNWDEIGISSDWHLFDDSSVRNVGSGTAGGHNGVVSPAAYVLFYRRRNWH